MNIEEHSFYSNHLGREMPFKRYGTKGKVIVVFPSSGGRYFEYEGFRMIDAISWFIYEGHVQVFTVDSIDNESLLSKHKSPYDAAQAHNAYDRYISEEFVPFVQNYTQNPGPYLATGCSMGGYHSLNFFLRHPDIFDTVIALSGVYDVRYLIESDYHDFNVYENSPVDYIWGMEDPWYLEHYRKGRIIVATGQGRWEEQSIKDTKKMEEAFISKNIPAWIDYWGYDVDHDWPWWQKMIAYYLGELLKQGHLF